MQVTINIFSSASMVDKMPMRFFRIGFPREAVANFFQREDSDIAKL